jgi:RHS repeat-associated protein
VLWIPATPAAPHASYTGTTYKPTVTATWSAVAYAASYQLLVALAVLWSTVALAKTVHYHYTDPQGTVLAKTDASGHILVRSDYRPYGRPVQAQGALPAGPGYTGHVNDPDTGLVYMQARYYYPEACMLSVDPVAPVPGDVFGFNR